ncbi:transcriptional regulator [Streptomyces sp. NPDC059373]
MRTPTERDFDAALAGLAAEQATGALYGNSGVVYLCDGAVVHAESPSSPDLGIRLITCGRLSAEAWRKALAEAGRDRRVGPFLVEHGCLTRGELELCHLGALFDAAYFVLLPDSEPTRFLRGATHWLGTVRPVRADALRRESVRRRALLDRVWPWPAADAHPVVPRVGRGGVPDPGQRAVLEVADGSRTPAQIAWLLGRSAFTTVLDVRRLAAAGYVETPTVPRQAPPLPDTGPGTDIELLTRIRDALEARL